MWTRKIIKRKARGLLRITYLKAFLVSSLIGLAGGSYFNSVSNVFNNSQLSDEFYNNILIKMNFNILRFIFFVLLISIFMMFLRIFVGFMVEIGGRKFFLKALEQDINLGYLGHSFKENRYLGILKTMFLRDIFLFLWTLLLIIPGIVKSYAYRMVPFILADNPNIGAKRAIQLSNQMTNGVKEKIFVLDLSFLGWYFIGLMGFFISERSGLYLQGLLIFIAVMLLVNPYVEATNAELYQILRNNAIDRRLTTHEELNLKELIIKE